MNLIQRSYRLQLSAGQEIEVNAQGHMFQVTEAQTPFEITFDGSNRFIGVTTGMGSRFGQNYERVTLRSPTAQSVVIVLGFGDFKDSRLNVNATITTSAQASDELLSDGDQSVGAVAVRIAEADETRKELLIQVPSDALNGVRVGGLSVTQNSGLQIEPGMTLALSVEGAVYAIRDGVSNVTISTLSLSRSAA